MHWEEKESVLVSLFAIHKTGDPDEIVREAMDSVLSTYIECLKSTLRKEIESRKRGSNECWHTAGQICAACEVNTTLDEILNLPTIRSTEV